MFSILTNIIKKTFLPQSKMFLAWKVNVACRNFVFGTWSEYEITVCRLVFFSGTYRHDVTSPPPIRATTANRPRNLILIVVVTVAIAVVILVIAIVVAIICIRRRNAEKMTSALHENRESTSFANPTYLSEDGIITDPSKVDVLENCETDTVSSVLGDSTFNSREDDSKLFMNFQVERTVTPDVLLSVDTKENRPA